MESFLTEEKATIASITRRRSIIAAATLLRAPKKKAERMGGITLLHGRGGETPQLWPIRAQGGEKEQKVGPTIGQGSVP